jgi:metallo-beta-lactamase family protein
MHLLEAGRRKVLLDCGLYQANRDEAHRRNARFPFSPGDVDAVLLSHAHIDHCGNLPTFVRQGYEGPVYCTPATRDLLRVMLVDSAKIQEEDAAHLNIQRSYAHPWVEPLYTRADVEQVLAQCVPLGYEKPRDLMANVRFRFIEAGHVLGSAMVHVTAATKNGERSMTFTGDLGRRTLPLLRPSAPIPPADLLVCESTYGNRVHDDVEHTLVKLHDTINRAIRRGGKVLIPAFSLGRTQLVIHYLQQAIRRKSIPRVPIYVDSPLAADITEVYALHPEGLSEEAQELMEEEGILGGDLVEYIRDFEDSLRVTRDPEPMIVVASSGMCDAGRILHHLKQHVDDPRCAVILVSFQAPGTTGRRLMEKSPKVRFMGKEWNKWIEVVHLDGFSAHADRDDFLAYLAPLAGKVKHTRLIHGEGDQAEAMARTMRELGFADVSVPRAGERVAL